MKKLALVVIIAAPVVLLITLFLTREPKPAGEEWVSREIPVRMEMANGTLFVDKRIAPLVREHYRDSIEAWTAAIDHALDLESSKGPAVYFFYDRSTFNQYARPGSRTTRAFYEPRTHEVYVHGNFVGGQLTNLDEEGTMAHELTHAVIGRSIGIIPVWLDEGLAHFIEQGALSGDQWFPGIPPMEQINAVYEALDTGDFPDLGRLFKLKYGQYYGHDSHLHRGTSVLLITYLHQNGQLRVFLEKLKQSDEAARSGAVVQELENACGLSTPELEQALKRSLTGRSDLKAFGAGLALANADRHAEAIEFYREAIELNPSEGLYWDRLGLSLYMNSEADSSDESFQAFRRAAASRPYPGQLTALTIVANEWFKRGRVAEARQAYEKVLERSLPTPTILHHLALSYIDEDRQKARDLVEQALALPRDGGFFSDRFRQLEELSQELSLPGN